MTSGDIARGFPEPPEGYVIVSAEQAELGRAWERVEAALPEGWTFLGLRPMPWTASAQPTPSYRSSHSGGLPMTTWLGIGKQGPTPAAALNALADALEAKGDPDS